MFAHRFKQGFLGNVRGDILSGMTVAFALIPEAIAFSLMAGVDPMVGLYASFLIAITISFVGGRPGMISAATGAMASLVGPLVAAYGVEYLFAATVLTGIVQWLLGVVKFGRFLSFVPHSVMIGFVNALAIIIFLAQLPNFRGANWQMYAMLAGTLVIIYALPRFTKAIPSALVAIVVMTILSWLTGADVRTVGDMGEIRQALPFFHLPSAPLSLDMFLIIAPYSLALAIVGITESLLTATLVDDLTETGSDKNREIRGQGIANFVTGFFGGMAGCAMIGQTVINIKSGGRTRLSTLVAGVFLLLLLLLLGGVVKQIPMAALVGVMFMVSIGTFDWQSIRTLPRIPRGDAIVMVATVLIVVKTGNLAIGVVAGIVLSAVHFGWKMAKLRVDISTDGQGIRIYAVTGQLFFGTMSQFVNLFDYRNDPQQIIIDFSRSHIWDQSALQALLKVQEKYAAQEKTVTVTGLNNDSEQLLHQNGLSSLTHQ